MACTLYVICNGNTIKIGTYKDRTQAMKIYTLMYNELRSKHGTIPKPVYVDTKGKK